MVRASLTYLAAPCMLGFCSYHIITSSGIGNVESICQLSLSLLFSPLCAFDFGHIILPCIECFELFFLLLLIFFYRHLMLLGIYCSQTGKSIQSNVEVHI